MYDRLPDNTRNRLLPQLSASAARLIWGEDDSGWGHSQATWITLHFVDSVLTWIAVSMGMYELNPFLALAAGTYGVGMMLWGKMTLAILIGLMIWNRVSHRVKGTLNMCMAGAVIANSLFVGAHLWLIHLFPE
ncbi:MAG: hypothetical protein IBX68_02895 [Dehalococcoidia bacterium]|nr:hypothetical protein [Dehalococcoidia bacterium]